MTTDKTFLHCEKCGKRLIARLPNGLFHFVFGKKVSHESPHPVQIFIHGSIKMQCLRRSCGHMNVFTYFPPVVRSINQQSKVEDSRKESKKETD